MIMGYLNTLSLSIKKRIGVNWNLTIRSNGISDICFICLAEIMKYAKAWLDYWLPEAIRIFMTAIAIWQRLLINGVCCLTMRQTRVDIL